MKIVHRLTLYRRHSKACSAGHPKDLRIYEHDSTKATKRKQCGCTIVAQGTLPSGRFLKHPSTGETAFARAHQVVSLWWEWGDVNPPAEVALEHQAEQQKNAAVSIGDAVSEFLAAKEAENVSQGIKSNHRILLRDRLVPFAQAKGFGHIQQMDNAMAWAHFRQSWKNLNPLQNRKSDGAPVPLLDVAPATAKRLLGQTREFIRFCIGRGWLTQEWAARKFLKVISKTEPKEPFTDEDVNAILEATQFVTDRGKTGQANSRELLVFCYVLRYSGLRISDVTNLDRSALVPTPGDEDNYSLRVFMTKTRKWVFIPIPSGDIPGAPNVAAALQSLPSKCGNFYFMGGKCVLQSNIKSWSERLGTLFSIAQKKYGALSVHPHPHRFRHTYAARLLESGMDVRDVAEYLGDTVAVVLKHYAKFTVAQQKIAAQRWKERMTNAATKKKSKLKVIERRKVRS